MNNHKIGRTTVLYRQTIVARVTNERLRPTDFVRNFGISVRTVHKWLRCHREGGGGQPRKWIKRSQYPAAQAACGV